MSHFAKWDHPHPLGGLGAGSSPLPSEGEGTGPLPTPSRLIGLAHPRCLLIYQPCRCATCPIYRYQGGRGREQDPALEFSRGIGSTVLWAWVERLRVTATDWHNGVATPLDPSTVLRVSGPTPGMDSRLGARQRRTCSIFDRLWGRNDGRKEGVR